MPKCSIKLFINGLLKSFLMIGCLVVGYALGFTQNYYEIQNNKEHIALLETQVAQQQIEIDKFKQHSQETETIKATLNQLSERIVQLENLIKARGIQ